MHIFAISAGHTGTTWLTDLIGENLAIESVHEFVGYDDFGTRTPDIRVMRNFNEAGMTPVVEEFWNRKIEEIGGHKDYCETNHTFAKCGLVEYLAESGAISDVVFLNIRRNWTDLCASFVKRGDFSNKTLVWQWFLHHTYNRKILDASPFLGLGNIGPLFWYIAEIETRQEYYKQLYSGQFRFIDCALEDFSQPEGAKKLLEVLGFTHEPKLPEKRNEVKSADESGLKAKIKQNVDRINGFDSATLAENFIKSGQRLAAQINRASPTYCFPIDFAACYAVLINVFR